MAVKRYLPQPSNALHKKTKLDYGGRITVENLKGRMINESSIPETIVLGTKTFDINQLGSMVDILVRHLPTYDFIKEYCNESLVICAHLILLL